MQKSEILIPFIVEERARPISQDLHKKQALNMKTSQFAYGGLAQSGDTPDDSYLQDFSNKVARFAASGLKALVRTFKEDICKENSKGEFEITLKVDASGKVLGIGASGEGGLKALIRCD